MGEGGLNREGGLLNFPPLKRGGGLIRERGAYWTGGLNRGFTVFAIKNSFSWWQILTTSVKQNEVISEDQKKNTVFQDRTVVFHQVAHL